MPKIIQIFPEDGFPYPNEYLSEGVIPFVGMSKRQLAQLPGDLHGCHHRWKTDIFGPVFAYFCLSPGETARSPESSRCRTERTVTRVNTKIEVLNKKSVEDVIEEEVSAEDSGLIVETYKFPDLDVVNEGGNSNILDT